MNFGYARVSARDQNLDTQLSALQAAGVDRIFQEKITGVATSRPELDQLLDLLRPGDTLTVAHLSRLGRSSVHVIQLVQQLGQRDVRFVSLDLGIDTRTPAGRMILTVFAALSEYERESQQERKRSGIALAKARGTHMGRRPGLDTAKLAKVKTALDAGLSLAKVVELTGISETTVKRYRRALRNE